MGLASWLHCETAGDVLGPTGSLVLVFPHRATNHTTSDPRNVYDRIDIPSGKEIGLVGNAKAITIKGIDSFSLKMHSKTDLNIILAGV